MSSANQTKPRDIDPDDPEYKAALRRLATSDRSTAWVYELRYRRLYDEEPES